MYIKKYLNILESWKDTDLWRVTADLSFHLTVQLSAAVTITYQTQDDPMAWPDGLPSKNKKEIFNSRMKTVTSVIQKMSTGSQAPNNLKGKWLTKAE